jgi:hypothetical protein
MGCLTSCLNSMQRRMTWRMSHEATIINTTHLLKSPTLSIPHLYHSSSLHLSPSLPPCFSHSLSPSLPLSTFISHLSLSLSLPPSSPLYSTHSDPPIISLWLSLTLTSSLPIYLSPLSFFFSTYLSNTHPLYLFIPII